MVPIPPEWRIDRSPEGVARASATTASLRTEPAREQRGHAAQAQGVRIRLCRQLAEVCALVEFDNLERVGGGRTAEALGERVVEGSGELGERLVGEGIAPAREGREEAEEGAGERDRRAERYVRDEHAAVSAPRRVAEELVVRVADLRRERLDEAQLRRRRSAPSARRDAAEVGDEEGNKSGGGRGGGVGGGLGEC